MSTKKQYLTYRGALRALTSYKSELIFGTSHEEGVETGVYFAEPGKGKMRHAEMPGAVALVHDEKTLFAAGVDGHLYRGNLKRAELEPVGERMDPAPVALALIANEQIAVAHGMNVMIMARADGSVHQHLKLDEGVTCLASDATGEWLVVGSDRGMVTVFEREQDKKEFVKSASAKLHEGMVSGLMFETEELRVLSTGSDQKLLVTHVRGELEAEDRGGKSMHDKAMTAMIPGMAGRFYTASLDSSIKAWPAGRTNQRPTTQKDGVVRTMGLAMFADGERAYLATACLDNTIRVYALDEEGKVGECEVMLYDAMAWARHLLAEGDPKQRQDVLTSLFNFNDTPSLELLSQRIKDESDHKLMVYATELLGKSKHDRARTLLEPQLSSSVEDVRAAAFHGLVSQYGSESLHPLELALKTTHKQIGVFAVHALGRLAKKDDRALEMLITTLDKDPQAVRHEAYMTLEKHYGSKSPESGLLAIKSSHTGLMCTAIIRFNQLGLLGDARVDAALRRLLEHSSDQVRTYAFMISLHRSPALVEILRSRDVDLHRQIFEIESHTATEEARKKGPEKLKVKPVTGLKDADYEPLFEAMASRSLETCLRGAMGLAALQDTRAFGTLLQLSRERDTSARVQTARALEKLGDPRSLKRLRMMIRDGDAAVRDAAFSALGNLETEEPLTTAQAGLNAEHEDVRQRGLEVLTKLVRKKSPDERAMALLGRTLNDQFVAVRSEALKVCLNKDVFASSEEALRFANESVFADVREKVLIEVVAQHKDDWAWNMLLEFMDDSAKNLRKEAFNTALSKAKRDRRQQSLVSALKSRYTDVRLLAVNELTSRRLEDVEDLLMMALDDEEHNVRKTAIGALVTANAQKLLVKAMDAKHVDVQVTAAQACARVGDERALDTLTRIVALEEPDAKNDPADHKRWLSHVNEALIGLAELGDPSARDVIVGLIESEHAVIRQSAVRALVWCSRQDALGTLREVVKHQDAAVQKEAALGLSYWGDALGSSMVFGGSASADEQILASLGLFEEEEDHLYAFLDQNNQNTRRRVFLLLMLLELSEGDGIPDKCLAAISSEHPDVRLRAAQGIEAFVERNRFEAFVLEMLNTRAGMPGTSFSLNAEIMHDLSRALATGSTPVRIRAARLLETLYSSTLQEDFERAWETYTVRYRKDLDALAKAQREAAKQGAAPDSGRVARAWNFIKDVAKRATGSSNEFNDALRQLAFGAFVGLSREPSSDTIRLGALRTMRALCERDATFAHETRRVMLLGLGDRHHEVRAYAMDALLALDMPVQPLATEALATGFPDMGSRGLTLLAEQVSAKDGEALLKETMLTKTDGLELEALKLLQARHDDVFAWSTALAAASSTLRHTSTIELLSLWATHEGAKKALVDVALSSRFKDVRWQAASSLAYRSDLSDKAKKLVFTILAEEKLQEPGYSEQVGAMRELSALDAPRAAEVLLDRVAQDTGGTAQTDLLIGGAGSTRSKAIIKRLYDMIEQNINRSAAFNAAFTISGYDQYIQDREDESVETREEWMKSQHPRHDEILAHLIDLAFRLADAGRLQQFIPAARWSLGKEVDEVLIPLVGFSLDAVQEAAIEAIGWRARKRDGDVAILRRVLSGGSPNAQFLAAEGLALSGHRDGLSVLMTAVNYMEDYDMRRRAIKALGELADPQSLDLLLSIAQDDESYLRAAAAESIGHMASSDRADQIFKLLVRLAKQQNVDVSNSALTGLRYFDTVEAWRVIRSHALDQDNWWRRETVARLLGELDDPANIDLLRKLILTDNDYDVLNAAAEGLQKLYGPDSLEPDYIFIQSEDFSFDVAEDSIARLCERGEVSRLLEILPKIHFEDAEDVAIAPLVNAMLSRTPLPVDEVAPKLADDHVRIASVAIQIIGRAGKALAGKHAKKVVEALRTTHTQWLEAYGLLQSNPSKYRQRFLDVTQRYTLLTWAAGQLETGLDELGIALNLHDVPETYSIRKGALIAIAEPWTGAAGVAHIKRLVSDDNAEFRELASAALGELAKAEVEPLLKTTLEDAVTFNRLIVHVDREAVKGLLRESAQSIHLQGVVIGHMTELGDEAGLLAMLKDRSLSDELRLGAVDGLATLATKVAIDALAQIGKTEEEDEDLRKAAWRARRRAVRTQKNEVAV